MPDIVFLCVFAVFSGVASEFADFVERGSLSIARPAFIDFTSLSSGSVDMRITEFGIKPGFVEAVKNISGIFTGAVDPATLNHDLLGEDYVWPNEAANVPDGCFSDEKMSAVCKGTDCRLFTVADGFLVPGKQTGSIYLQPVLDGEDADVATPLAKVAIAAEEKDWYYHMVSFVDVDGDGLKDILTGRAYTNMVGKAKGELVWLKQPASVEEFLQPWPLQVLTEGPDVITLVDTTTPAPTTSSATSAAASVVATDDAAAAAAASSTPAAVAAGTGMDMGTITVYAAEFFGEQLSETVIRVGAVPTVDSYTVLDDTLGAAYDLHLVDLTGDGVTELVVSTHEGKEGGAIYAYERPPGAVAISTPTTTTGTTTTTTTTGTSKVEQGGWVRHTLVSGFEVTKRGMNQASPGFVYPFYRSSSSSNTQKTTKSSATGISSGALAPNTTTTSGSSTSSSCWFLVAGDGSQAVHIVYPINTAPSMTGMHLNSTSPGSVSDPFAFQMETIINVGGTVGSLALMPIPGQQTTSRRKNKNDGGMGAITNTGTAGNAGTAGKTSRIVTVKEEEQQLAVAVPDYDHDIVYFYTFF